VCACVRARAKEAIIIVHLLYTSSTLGVNELRVGSSALLHRIREVQGSGVPRGVVWGVQPPPEIPNYSCLQNPWLGGHCPQIPVLSVLSSAEFIEPPPNKSPGYATGPGFKSWPRDRLLWLGDFLVRPSGIFPESASNQDISRVFCMIAKALLTNLMFAWPCIVNICWL
jgi:hypothetical protein